MGNDASWPVTTQVVPLPPLADKIEARVALATVRVEKTTQAILAKAFRGELVPTEAELARQQNRHYEPATALLERIRAEREAAGAAPPKGPRRRTQRT
jgi:type I restriction enzyme S subunit